MNIKLRKVLAIVTLALSLSVSISAQKLWIQGRADYSKIFTNIKSKQALKIMHIGDSHIQKGYTSAPIRSALLSKYGNRLNFTYWGINGSTYTSWLQEQNIAKIKEETPDLLIVSLGTNDSYTRRFSSESLRSAMQNFMNKVKELSPNTKLIFTTPPANYLRDSRTQVVGYTKAKRKKARKPIYKTTTAFSFNPNARIASNTIKYFGQANAIPVIDLHAMIGTKVQAEEWLKSGLMASDHVHFTEQGYSRQGELIANALVQAIEDTK